MQQAQFSQQQQIQQQQQQQQPQQQQQKLQTNLQQAMQHVQTSQYIQSPYLNVELPNLYLKKMKPFSQISTAATPQANTSFAPQYQSPALLSNTSTGNNNAINQIQKIDSTPASQLYKQISSTPLLLSQNSQQSTTQMGNLTPSQKQYQNEQSKFKGNIQESDVKVKKKGSKRKKNECSADIQSRSPIISQVGRGKSQPPIQPNYQIAQTTKQNFNLHRNPLTPNFFSNQLVEGDILSKQGSSNTSAKKGNPSNINQKQTQNPLQAQQFSQGGLIELALKNKSTQKKQAKNNYQSDMAQDEQRTIESKQSYQVNNYENQESVAQYLPFFNGMKTPFSKSLPSQKLNQQLQQVGQQQQSIPSQLYQQIQSIYAEPPDYNLFSKGRYNNFQNIPGNVLLQQYQQKQPNQSSQYQSIIPKYFEGQQQFKEVNLLTSSISSNSSGNIPQLTENQIQSNNDQIVNTKSNPQIFNAINQQANKNQNANLKQSNKKNTLDKSQSFYQNTHKQSNIYSSSRPSTSQENYMYYLENDNNKHEVKEEEGEEEEDEEEEEDDDEEEESDQIQQQQKQYLHENMNSGNKNINTNLKQSKWSNQFLGVTNQQQRIKQIQQNLQINQQNVQSNQDQNIYSQYNSDDFQEEDEHENKRQCIQFYAENDYPLYYDNNYFQQYQQGQNMSINPNGNQVYEITESEDDDDDEDEEQGQHDQQFRMVGMNIQNDIYYRNDGQEVSEEEEEDEEDEDNQFRVNNKANKNISYDENENQLQSSDNNTQRNDIKMYNQSDYQQMRINMESKNNLSVDKLNSLSQVNTSNYDQMKSLISPKNKVGSYQHFSTLKFQKSSSNNNQLRSNASLGEDGNNQFEYELEEQDDSQLANLTINKNPSNTSNKCKQIQTKKKSNTISSKGSYMNEQDLKQEGNKAQSKNTAQYQSQQNQNFNNPKRNSSKKKSKTAHYQPQHQMLYKNYNQEGFQQGIDINNDYFQNNQVGGIVFAQQQQQVQFNNCNQYKFNIQNVNIQHPGAVSQIIENKSIYKNNNQPENIKINNFNQNDINMQHQLKGLDQIYEVREVNNSIIEKQVPEPPPPAGSQFPKYEVQQANNLINFSHKSSFSSTASKMNINQTSQKNLDQNNNSNANSKRGSIYNHQSGSNNNQIIDPKQKIKLMHFSSNELTPQGSQLGNTPHKSFLNLNNFSISPRLYGNDKINNTQITQSILFVPSQQQQQQQQYSQLKRDHFFLEDQQENLKLYLVNKKKEKLQKKQSDDATSITNHLTNSPNNNNNSNTFSNNNNTNNPQQKVQNQGNKNKGNKQNKNSLKICMSTVLLDSNNNNDENKNTKQRVYSQQPYLEDPQIKKKWVLNRVSKMQIDQRLADQLIEEINLYQHTKEVILEKLIQSILSYQTLKAKLQKKDNTNEISVVQATKNRTTQIFRQVSQLFTSTSNSNPSQQEIQQKIMQRMANNGPQAAVVTTLNNRTTTNDNQNSEQEDTHYEKDYIQENNSYDDEKKAEVKNASLSHFKDIFQTTMATTTTAAGQLSGYNNNSHIHSINNLPSSFISKKTNYLKGTTNEKNNTINTMSSINNLQTLSNQALKAISNVSYNNPGSHSTRPNSVNMLSDNNIPANTINGSIYSSSNIQLVQQNSQQASLFSPQIKEKYRLKKNNKNLNQFDIQNNQQLQSIILEQDSAKQKKSNNVINFQQVNSDNKQGQIRIKEINKLHNFNQKMDISSMSISIDPMNAMATPKLASAKKSVQMTPNKDSKSLEYKQNQQTISNFVQAILPSQQSQRVSEFQVNQREQSFSFNNQNICPICQNETQLFALNYKCEHKFCMFCIRQYIESKIYNNDVMKILCPYKNCRYKLRSEHMKPYISQEMFDKFKALRKIVFKRMNPNVRYCTRPDCDGYMIGDEEHPKLTCKKCFQEVCFHCCNNWHQGLRCDQAILEEDTEDAQKEIGKQTCPICHSKLNIFQQIDGVQYSNKNMCSACNKSFCNLCRRQCGQFHFAPWNICYGCPGQKYSLEEPQCCEKFCIFLWGVMKLMMYIFVSLIALAIYPFIVAVVSLFMPLIIYAYFKGNRLQYNGIKKYLLLFSLFLLGIILYPVWLLFTFIPGTCLFFKDMYLEKRLYGNEIDASQVNV